ncbi:DEAD/DEAH box helicase [Halomonas sp. M4R1S46]|uniref:DEAD/DEAH box helicase n=1 Tax=Halomonas sp. M4R1S46 TaxID=2982692 RepID=UPI0021E40116|nr:DEAD/DEAH box helicase [Halomonas sp. M4R1S46]UYG09390.1 DEAD/DEAH box helicase [Halomonas sp. M4R1S46]
MTFSDLGLSAELLRAIDAQGYTTPTPIQRQAIPAVLQGGDLLASAQTGTGKTAGFTLPMLQRLSGGKRPAKRGVRALVLTPTRELAAQVGESVRDYGRHLPLTSHVIFGGVGQQPQVDALRPGLDILVATPGRLLDLHQQGHVDLSRVEILVLDEADRMLDMGFIHDIKKVLKLLPEKRQNLLFSATFSNEIQALANKLLDAPTLIEVARRNTTAETVDQAVYRVDREKKRDLLAHLISAHRWHQVLVFTRTKHGANRLAEHLGKQDIPAMAIHGNKSQSARTRALSSFKSGELQVLVATDIAARGLDIDELPHVVNFELPNVAEDYVHRIGRTGRAGNDGQAVSLVCVDEHGLLKNIERLIKRDLEKHIEPGFEPDPNAKPEPIENGRGNRGGGRERNGGGGRGGKPQQAQGGRGSDDGQRPSRRRRRGGQGRQQA